MPCWQLTEWIVVIFFIDVLTRAVVEPGPPWQMVVPIPLYRCDSLEKFRRSTPEKVILKAHPFYFVSFKLVIFLVVFSQNFFQDLPYSH